MTNPVISVEHLTKQYDLGVIGTGTLSRDLNRWWARVRKQPDPYTQIGQRDAFERIGETILALDDVSFQVQQGEALGIIGRNGAGKSTLLKILSRVTAPTSGVVKVRGRIGSLLEVGTGFHPELTGRENVYLNGAILGMRKDEVARKFDEIVDFSGVEKFIDTPVKRYSSGMYVRLAFAVAAHLDPEILIVDEVLAVGDAEFQKKCLGKMGDVAGEGRTVLFVSHNMEAILNLCSQSLVFDEGKIFYSGVSEESINKYLNIVSHFQSGLKPHVIYESNSKNDPESIYVNKIEILDSHSLPKVNVYTWDPIKIRVHYYSNQTVKVSSLIIDIVDYKQQRIAVFDSGSKLKITEGFNFIDCYLPQIPFSAGDYFVGVGFAIPNAGFLWRKKNLAVLKIFGKDVFNLGRPPVYSRMILAVPHEWKTE